MQDLKEIQKLRKRQQGVSAEDLAATKTEKKEEKVEVCEQSCFRNSYLVDPAKFTACPIMDREFPTLLKSNTLGKV